MSTENKDLKRQLLAQGSIVQSAQSLLQQQVPNPFYIGNFASLQTSNPALYARMASNSLFTARTTHCAIPAGISTSSASTTTSRA